MTRELLRAFALALAIGIGGTDATAQGLRVAVGINTPPVAARIVFGDDVHFIDRAYLMGEPVHVVPVRAPRRVVIYGPYARRYRHHYAWVEYERARLARLYLTSHDDHSALRAFERERARRERELEREYRSWLREHRYDRGPGRGWARGGQH